MPPYLSELTLEQVAEEVAHRKLPPLEHWNHAGTGDSHMRIAADGRWFHEGSPIGREAMVRAFSTLLSRDEQGRSEEHTSELQSLMRTSYAVFCLKKKNEY